MPNSTDKKLSKDQLEGYLCLLFAAEWKGRRAGDFDWVVAVQNFADRLAQRGTLPAACEWLDSGKLVGEKQYPVEGGGSQSNAQPHRRNP